MSNRLIFFSSAVRLCDWLKDSLMCRIFSLLLKTLYILQCVYSFAKEPQSGWCMRTLRSFSLEFCGSDVWFILGHGKHDFLDIKHFNRKKRFLCCAFFFHCLLNSLDMLCDRTSTFQRCTAFPPGRITRGRFVIFQVWRINYCNSAWR